jgi:JAB1/Mov34/MPN/PAD-1 ubiquitin protease
MTSSTAMDETKAMETDDEHTVVTTHTKKLDVSQVIIHPLVLLSVADHYHRVARGTRKRVVGVLLGQVSSSSSSSNTTGGTGAATTGGRVDATNSFAVPFEEDSKNPVCSIYTLLLYTIG